MDKVMTIILSGDHGAGKSTLASEIITAFNWVMIIPQYTSRKPRNDGQETENYFVSIKEVEKCDIVGEYIDGDGSHFKMGYKLSEIKYALSQGCFPLLIGHKALIRQLREILPKESTLEIFLKCNKSIAVEKIMESGLSTLEKAKSRLERGWIPEIDISYTDFVITNGYNDATKRMVLEIIGSIHSVNLSTSSL